MTGEKPFECKTCKRKFANSQNMKSHERTHLDEKTYELKGLLNAKNVRKNSNLMEHYKFTKNTQNPLEIPYMQQSHFSKNHRIKFFQRKIIFNSLII